MPHVSHSQLNTWEDCQKHWAEIYLRGNRDPNSVATFTGSLVHDPIAWAFREKMDGRPPSWKDIQDELYRTWQRSCITSPPDRWDKTSPEGVRNTAEACAHNLWNRISHLEPLHVEDAWEIPVTGDWTISIRPDLITKNLHTFDWKTESHWSAKNAGIRWSLAKAEEHDQPGIYGAGMRERFGLKEVMFTFFVVRKVVPFQVDPYPVLVDEARMDAALARAERLINEIEFAKDFDLFHKGTCTWKRECRTSPQCYQESLCSTA